jgi:phosphopentomutase
LKRAIVIVMDGCGAGATPDAAEFGDLDSPSTIRKTWEIVKGIKAPTLINAGFFTACGVGSTKGLPGFHVEFGRLLPLSRGKDSVTGHWEMMGIHTEVAFPTYPDGFPLDLIQEFERRIGRRVLGNRSSSGTTILTELGAEHVRSGCPILYTSADSVFQIACHESIIPVAELYKYCEIARELCVAPHNVQRVIARPFIGSAETGFKRTERRKDYPFLAPANLVDAIQNVYGIGVVPELFGERGFLSVKRSQNNVEHAVALQLAMESDAKFIFANFEDFDMLYGHRNDARGFAKCLEDFDHILSDIISRLQDDDMLILTADHGNDPTSLSTDHSREYSPFCVITAGEGVTKLGDQDGLWQVGQKVAEFIGTSYSFPKL